MTKIEWANKAIKIMERADSLREYAFQIARTAEEEGLVEQANAIRSTADKPCISAATLLYEMWSKVDK